MHLRRNAVIVTVVLAAVIVVVIAGVTFMGVFGGGGPTKDDPASHIDGLRPEGPLSATNGTAGRRPSTTTTTPGTGTVSGTQ